MPRRAKETGTTKRYSVSVRVTDQTRDMMIAAARHSRRSIAQEIEMRLQASFDIPAIVAEAIAHIERKRDEALDYLSMLDIP